MRITTTILRCANIGANKAQTVPFPVVHSKTRQQRGQYQGPGSSFSPPHDASRSCPGAPGYFRTDVAGANSTNSSSAPSSALEKLAHASPKPTMRGYDMSASSAVHRSFYSRTKPIERETSTSAPPPPPPTRELAYARFPRACLLLLQFMDQQKRNI